MTGNSAWFMMKKKKKMHFPQFVLEALVCVGVYLISISGHLQQCAKELDKKKKKEPAAKNSFTTEHFSKA